MIKNQSSSSVCTSMSNCNKMTELRNPLNNEQSKEKITVEEIEEISKVIWHLICFAI